VTISAKELKEMIRVLRKNGVKRYKNGDLEIVLEDQTIDTSKTSSTSKPRASRKADQIEKDAFVAEEIQTKDEQLSLLQIENPVEFEKMLLEGDLEDEDRPQH
jgi:hypothetical protein